MKKNIHILLAATLLSVPPRVKTFFRKILRQALRKAYLAEKE